MEIYRTVKDMLKIVEALQETYPKKNSHSITLSVLQKLNETVNDSDRIVKRANKFKYVLALPPK